MKNLNVKILSLGVCLALVSAISYGQQKPSERSLKTEMRTIETIKAKRAALVTRLQQNAPIESGDILIQRNTAIGQPVQQGPSVQRGNIYKHQQLQAKPIVD